MLRKIILFQIPFLLILFVSTFAQTPRQVIVEHFTNTRCSICASKNPGFYSLLHNSYPQVLHIAYHPSAPYSNCYFSLQNPTENNSRTNFYGVYGSTPRAVIQGNVIPIKTPLVSAADFDVELNQFSPFALNISIEETATDSFLVRLVITTAASHTHTTLNLYAAVTEDSIFYNANNGETLHFDVFRNQLFSTGSYSFSAPQSIGDSVVIESSIQINTNWQKQQVSVIGIIQEPTSKDILQAARQSDIINQTPTSVSQFGEEELLTIYPNPAQDEIRWGNSQVRNIAIYSTTGHLLEEQTLERPSLSTIELPNGVYFLRLKTIQGDTLTKRLVISR